MAVEFLDGMLKGWPVEGVAKPQAREAPVARRAGPMWIALEETRVEVVLVLLGLVVGRASLLGELFPFGAAFAFAVARCGMDRRTTIVALSVFAGMSSALPFYSIWQYAAVLIAMALVGRRVGMRPERDGMAVLAGFSIFLIMRAVPALAFERSVPALASVLIEALIMSVMIEFNSLSLRFWFRFHKSQSLSSEETFAIAVLACSVVLGITAVHLGPIDFGGAVARLLVMVGATVGGPAIGSALGAAAGLTVFIGGQHLVGLYALSGLLGGSFRHFGRPGVVCGFLFATLISSMDMATGAQVVAALAETGLAAVGLMLVPGQWLTAGARLVPGTVEHTDRETVRERRLRELVSKRLRGFSRIFGELAHAFRQGSPVDSAAAKTFPCFLENVVGRSCRQCTGYQVCWQEKLYKSYIMMLDLLTLAEVNGSISMSDLPDGLANKCLQPQALVNAINGAVEVCGAETVWERRLNESREIVSTQLRGVSHIMSGLASEIRLGLSTLEDVEVALREEFEKKGICLDDVVVTDIGAGRQGITVDAPACNGECACANRVAPLVGRALGQDFSVWNAKCSMGQAGAHCSFELVPQRRFDVVTEVIRVPKSGSIVSGDAHAILDLPGGKVALVLSDGMGGGPRAAMESGTTIGMLRQLMEAGFERDFAVRTINSVLMLRSPEETFSTIDMAIIDLHSGQTEFMKVGSAPSFVKRGIDVKTVKSSTVPVGILNSIEVQSHTFALRHGDMLVMVTDGAVDAVRHNDKEEWIATALRRLDTGNPKEIAASIYNMVRKESGKQTADDVTILVAKVLNRNAPSVRDDAGMQTLNTGHYAS